MTRLANIEKAGYYPLPPPVTDLLLTHISAPHGGRILDAAAGKGVALATFSKTLGLSPFGVELHEERAAEAEANIRALLGQQTADKHPVHILKDDYRNLRASKHGFNLLYLNPPYDHDVENGRLEYDWLVNCRPLLQPGGLLLWVVPQHILAKRRFMRYVASWFEQIEVYRFPDGEFERFKQVVLFGLMRKTAVAASGEAVDDLVALGKEAGLLPVLTAVSKPTYILPSLVVNKKAFTFGSRLVSLENVLAEARRHGVRKTAAWRQHLDPTTITTELKPLTPLKIGHMNNVIAAGFLNNQLLDDGQGTRLLIKGRSYKEEQETEMEEPLPGGGSKVTTYYTEQVVTDVTSLSPTGEVTSYVGADLTSFLKKWLSHLTKLVAKAHKPVYTFDLNGFGTVLNSLSKGRPIPGMNGRTGLLPAQKHAVAAVLTRLETHPDALVVGEMGTGKSSIGAAIAAGRAAQRTIILCPPHLVDKWQREAKIVWPSVRTMHLQSISDVDRFFDAQQPDDAPLIGVLKQTTARAASGWEHAYTYGGSPATHAFGSKGFVRVSRSWGNQLHLSGQVKKQQEETAVTWSLSPKQQQALHERGVRCPTCGQTVMTAGSPIAPASMRGATRFCNHCAAPLYQFTRRRADSQQPGSFKLYAQREAQIRSYTRQSQPVPFNLRTHWYGRSVADTFGYAKTPLAAYIKKRAKGRLDLLLIDEIHEYKGIDSDQGYAMHHLALAARKVVGLTGTIYGGKASSLFYLLFRTAPEMRRAYVDPDEYGKRRIRLRDWVSAYGILQAIETRTFDENGKQTGNSKSSMRYKELPGGSPAMLPWLLNRSVFLSLGNMGFPLPEYKEIPTVVPMAPEQALMYADLKGQLKDELKERLLRGDKSLLAGYLYALLFWPDSPRRAKGVTCPRSGKLVAHVKGLPSDFVGPKEQAIIERCRKEKAAGRRVMLFCQQTDTLDIQPAWQRMLEAAGLKTAVLRASPNKREAWVAKQVANGVDVIITHPKKVQTGLDLLDFPTLIWMSIDYSVYTVLQASRRSWRIGQTQPVKVYFYAYEESIQEDAMYLVAAKVAAALRINGETVDSDSLGDLDVSGDIVTMLAKVITGDAVVTTATLQQAFDEANQDLAEANVIIGDYEMIDEEEEELEVVAVVPSPPSFLETTPLPVAVPAPPASQRIPPPVPRPRLSLRL